MDTTKITISSETLEIIEKLLNSSKEELIMFILNGSAQEISALKAVIVAKDKEIRGLEAHRQSLLNYQERMMERYRDAYKHLKESCKIKKCDHCILAEPESY